MSDLPTDGALRRAPSWAGALASLVQDVELFETTIWGRHSKIWRASDGNRFEHVWSVEILDEFLANGVRQPLVRLIDHGRPCAPNTFTSGVRLGGRSLDDVVDPRRVAECFAAGATVVVQSLHRTCRPVREFVADLANDVSHPLQANAYLTPAGGVGLAPHADRHDVFVIQVDGTKRWSVDGLDPFELGPGDVLYIPAGTTHSASGTDVSSLHLTIGVLRITYRSLIDRLLDGGPDALSKALPLRYRDDLRPDAEPDDLEATTAMVLGEVIAHLDAIDPSDVTQSERRREVRRPPASGVLSAAVALSGLRLDDRIAAAHPGWHVEIRPDHVRIVGRDHWLSAPLSCREALEQLSTSSASPVAELAGLDDPSRLILAKRLLASGFCEVVHRTADTDGEPIPIR